MQIARSRRRKLVIESKNKELEMHSQIKYDEDLRRYFDLRMHGLRRADNARGAAELRRASSQQFVDLLRVGLALGRFHRLPDQRIEGFFLAGAEFGDHRRVGGQHLVDQRFDRAAVGDLL